MKLTFAVFFVLLAGALSAPEVKAQSPTFCAYTMCPIWCNGFRDFNQCVCDCVITCMGGRSKPKKKTPGELTQVPSVRTLLARVFEWDVPTREIKKEIVR